MANTIRILPLIFVIHIWTIHSLSLGPPKGSRGTIDWRYPDEIVQPLPSCENGPGVFPHPINCTWYYRCDDRIGFNGFFLRTYYECEPGTVFSDELDQCIFPHGVHPPCGTKGTSLTIGSIPPNGLVTDGPVTGGSVTGGTVTDGPVTGGPVIEGLIPVGPPATGRPVTGGTGTGVPVTEGPVTGGLVTVGPPATGRPVTGGTVTNEPVTDVPVTEGPVTGGLVTVGPPATGRPVTVGPATASPVTDGPVTGALITVGPATGSPVIAGPVIGGLIVGTVTNGPVTDVPVTEGPVTGGLVIVGPATGGPVTGGLVTVGPATASPVTDGPIIGGPATGGSVTGGLVTGGPVIGGLITGPATGGLVTGGPVDIVPSGSKPTVGPPGTPQPESQKTCQIKYSGCLMLNICPLNGSPSFQYQLCQKSNYDCYTDGELTLSDVYCPVNSFYNPQSQKCYYHPSAQELCAGSPSLLDYVVPTNPPVTVLETTTSIPGTTAKPTDTTETPKPGTISIEDSVTCSYANEKPDTDAIRRKFCNYYSICDNGMYKGQMQLCFNYYQCSKVEDEWNVIKMSCPPGQLYSFKENQCVDELKPEQLCAFFLRQTGVNGVPNAFYN